MFVSSANFTEAAQERNIEVGLFLRSRPLADDLSCILTHCWPRACSCRCRSRFIARFGQQCYRQVHCPLQGTKPAKRALRLGSCRRLENARGIVSQIASPELDTFYVEFAESADWRRLLQWEILLKSASYPNPPPSRTVNLFLPSKCPFEPIPCPQTKDRHNSLA
jgi:hypothetical protein